MKRFLILFTAIITVSLSATAYGALGKIIDNKTFVPVRGVFEELGFNVSYDNITATAIISNDSYTIKVPKGKTYFEVNGQSIKPDSPQTIVDGSMYLPLRAIGDSIGAAISWDNTSKIAHISYNGRDSYVNCSVSTQTQASPQKTNSATSSTSSSSRSNVNNYKTNSTSERIVYIGETGTKYHKSNCPTLKKNIYAIDLSKAIEQGRTACKVCGG